ncbi:MAG: phytase [Rhodanobacteraceae bacterium]|nr:phytase [Rhodanobacteraceae bacterium]MBL0042379.1 phytase [Xanthomonadales bacterium]
MPFRRPLLIAIVLSLSACASMRDAPEPDQYGDQDPMLSEYDVPHALVSEAFLSASTPDDNIDSPASWRAPDGTTWVFATAKVGGQLVIYDGDTGATLRRFGSEGDGPGQFRRPNGVAVHGDLLFVVERDNHRVQVLSLPALTTLTSFGREQLTQPYGLWVRELAPGDLEVIVTDAYMAGKRPNGWDIAPPLPELDHRMQRYRVTLSAGGASARHVAAFGDVSAAGAIRIPESIQGDVAHDRLLISEEDTMVGTAVREYDLAGSYRGRTIGLGTFKAQAEGIALWQCADGSGYWITTDQFLDRSVFHLYDRVTLEHLGAFAGNTVANTDGVWLNQSATTRFPNGVFYAVHDDQGVGAFDWRDIAKALNLRADCTSR